MQDERKRAYDPAKKEAVLEQRPDIKQIEEQVRRHGEIAERHPTERGRCEREQHRPACRLRRAGEARGEPGDENERAAREQRVAGPRNAEQRERREQQRESRPVHRDHGAGLARCVQPEIEVRPRQHPREQLRRELGGQAAGGERLRLHEDEVLVAGERMILCDEELARAQHDKRNERRRPRPAAERLDQREPGARERRPGSSAGDQDHQCCAQYILRAQEIVEDVAALRLLRKPGVPEDESEAEQPRRDAEEGEPTRAHRGRAHSRSRSA